jgi:hypothetical protein
VYDKKNDRELASQQSNVGFARYILEKAGQEQIDKYNAAYVKPGAEGWANDEMIRTLVPQEKQALYQGECEKIVWKDMGNAIRATVFGKLDDPDSQRYLLSYTLYENEPYVEINWGVDGKGPNPQPEAGWLSFDFNLETPEYRLYRTGGIVDPQREFVDNTNDTPGLFTFSKSKSLSTGKVFVNLYTNQWGTNFSEWIEGSFSSKMYIWSYDQYDSEGSFISPSEETRVPLKGVFYDGPAGASELTQKGLTLSRKGILLTAFKTLSDQSGMLLRLWEQAGKEGSCTITLPVGSEFKTAYPCNLRDEITGEGGIPISNQSFEIDIQANQPVSFILK